MLNELERIRETALQALVQAQDAESLEAWRVAHLGRKSPLMQVFPRLGQLSPEERPLAGKRANEIRQEMEAAYAERAEALRQEAIRRSVEQERLDVTLPGRRPTPGRLHPVTQTIRRITAIFAEMGFQVLRSREVETDEYNFQLLNIPPHHPAREMQDTFYMKSGGDGETYPVVLRTHTSPGQIHAMRQATGYTGEGPLPENPPPLRVVLPGMVYRYEAITARSEIQFTQVEGLAVGRNITFSDLKGTLADFARRMFGPTARVRFRASHFPFTEPSAEVDVECFLCGGKGCNVCKYTGWLEILGAGMVHPVVLRNGGYDPEKYTGFAFGMGPERITMLRHHIEDIRYFWSGDLRFLEQF
ncbi:MAG TPA: phenylalanine--tRNA ligase subunit alpha [Anaerolineae bacterium]|nr:phenylalanine--tRNA ligase subunit alpha [Anaerolineae bacterium]HID85589.1 phenylalanine--tRNA ligase subunit alpha [Anaerolineales bacterium]HIQ09375.1 phenylalanine--tRNA ligase subunit alpha [Anaerolineaceae bacterium]